MAKMVKFEILGANIVNGSVSVRWLEVEVQD